jgi:hypothetical protein
VYEIKYAWCRSRGDYFKHINIRRCWYSGVWRLKMEAVCFSETSVSAVLCSLGVASQLANIGLRFETGVLWKYTVACHRYFLIFISADNRMRSGILCGYSEKALAHLTPYLHWNSGDDTVPYRPLLVSCISKGQCNGFRMWKSLINHNKRKLYFWVLWRVREFCLWELCYGVCVSGGCQLINGVRIWSCSNVWELQ